MKEKILEMLNFQDKVNSISSHNDWRNWLTPTWKIINWKRCIYMESAEAIDSISWKHWKNIEGWIDKNNFNVELIDIWHFIMSYLLTKDSIENTCNFIIDNISWYEVKVKLPNKLDKENNLLIDKILEPYEKLMLLSLSKRDSIEYRAELVRQFFTCLNSAWINFEDLYKLYIWKNVLNKFRQDHGYKQWTYIKIWNWQEDNVAMQKILENTTWFDNIYSKLEEEYKKWN